MTKPKLLDLFCGAGGCTRGYQLAGFEVVGVDIKHQPRYVGEMFMQGDALAVLRGLIDSGEINEFDAVHASPPCQAFSMAAQQWRVSGKQYQDLVAPTRDLLIKSRLPYVIENVPGAPLINPIVLNAAFFGLNVSRDRLFEMSFEIPFFLLPQSKKPIKMGRPVQDGDVVTPVGHFSNVPYTRRVMGIDWMTQAELAQAIPPAYTEFIGTHLLKFIEERNHATNK